MKPEDVEKSDTQKILSELTQLRLMQFLICAGAFTLFTAGIAWITNDQFKPTAFLSSQLGAEHNTPQVFPVVPYAMSFVVLSGLTLFFLWQCRIRSLISMLAQYLIVRRLSFWEKHYREFASANPYASQTNGYRTIFWALGILSGVLPNILLALFVLNGGSVYPLEWRSATCVFGSFTSTIAYVILVALMSNDGRLRSEEQRFEKHWTTQLKNESTGSDSCEP